MKVVALVLLVALWPKSPVFGYDLAERAAKA